MFSVIGPEGPSREGGELDTEELVAVSYGLVERPRNEPIEQAAGVVTEDESKELFGGDGRALEWYNSISGASPAIASSGSNRPLVAGSSRAIDRSATSSRRASSRARQPP